MHKKRLTSTRKPQMKEKRFLVTGIIAFGITGLWVVYTIFQFLYHDQFAYSNVIDEYRASAITNFKSSRLLQGEKIHGKFTATEDNMGMVLIRFYNYLDISKDVITFRLKAENSQIWYYHAAYNVDQFQPDKYFPFGFPEITKAKGKMYVFEIESSMGREDDGIALSRKKPYAAAVYRFDKTRLKTDFTYLSTFAYLKIRYALHNADFSKAVAIYFLSFTSLLTAAYRKNIYRVLGLLPQTADRYRHSSNKWLRRLKKNPKIFLIIRNITQKIQRVIVSYEHSLRTYVPTATVILIFCIAVVSRLAYFSDQDVFNSRLMYSTIGGGGDYDALIKDTITFTLDPKEYLQLSLVNDNPILVRLMGFFLVSLGFFEGLHYFIIFTILLTSLVCVLPFFLLTRNKSFSVGGFIGSMLLAINPLAIWVASGRTVDAVTSVIFSIFILLFVLALQKRRWILVVLLGVVAFIDGMNRGIMLINDFPALVLFATFFISTNTSRKTGFPFFRVSKQTIAYALTPLALLTVLYTGWEVWYQRTFHEPWFIIAQVVRNNINLGSRFSAAYESGTGSTSDAILIHIQNAIVAFNELRTLLSIPYVLLSSLVLGVLVHIVTRAKRYKRYYRIAMPLLAILTFASLLPGDFFGYQENSHSEYLLFVVFAMYIFLAFAILGRIFILFAIIIVAYMSMLIFGYPRTFSERHFIQVLIPLLIIFSLTIDTLTRQIFSRKQALLKIFITIWLIGMIGFLFVQSGQQITKLISGIRFQQQEKAYLTEVGRLMPDDGIILVGMQGENPIYISRYTKRTIAYNINIDPVLFVNTEHCYSSLLKHPRKTIACLQQGNQAIRSELKKIRTNEFDLLSILQNQQEFNKYQFFVLDTDIKTWQTVLTQPQRHPFIPINTFTLQRVNDQSLQRALYRLQYQPTNMNQ